MAESIFKNVDVEGKYSVFSAGSKSSGKVNDFAIKFLESKNISTEGLSSKSLHQLPIQLNQDDLVVAVCGGAIDELCPLPNFNAQILRLILPDPAVPEIAAEDSSRFFSYVGSYLQQAIPTLIDMLNSGTDLSKINEYFFDSKKPVLV